MAKTERNVISSAELANAGERLCNPISLSELQRRWKAIRAEMSTAKIDALIVQGSNNLTGTGGYLRWFTGISVANSYPQTVIFPPEGLMTLVGHGAFNEDKIFDGKNPVLPGIGRRLGTPAFPGINYTIGYEAELVAREIKKSSYRSVGFVAPDNMNFGFGVKLKELLTGITLIDVTDMVDPIKAVKSPEEIELIRRAAALQDEVVAKVRGFIRPGMKDFEVMAYGRYVGELLGSETGYFLGSSSPLGQPAAVLRRAEQGREIRKGDIMFFQPENSGPGGYFTHLGRMIVLGKAPQEIRDAFSQMVEAEDFTLDLLKPGASCREIFQKYNAYMRAHGFSEEGRAHCHGQGYDLVERPLIRNDETMSIAENMNIGLHPHMGNERMFVQLTDNFLIGPGGKIEHLHKTPREVIEI